LSIGAANLGADLATGGGSMSPCRSVLRPKLRNWAVACTVIFAVTAAGVPASWASSATPGTAKAPAAARPASHAGQQSTSPDGKAPKPHGSARPDYTIPEQPNLNGAFVPVSPVRLLDTRSGIGTQGVKARVGQNTILLNVSGITGNPSVQPTAVVLNVTVVDPTRSTYVVVYPNSGGLPATSNLNASAGETVANQVTVQVGLDGDVDFYNAHGQTDLVADLAGYYTLDKAASNYVPDGPRRILDTRSGTGGVKGPVGPAQSVGLQVTGVQGVPSSGVTAVVMNVTVTAPTKSGFLTVYPDGTKVPATSSIDFTAGETRPNLVTVQVGADGKVDFYNDTGDVQVIADLAGYYIAGHPQAGGVFQSVGPTRILDTRNGTGGIDKPLGPQQSISLLVAGNTGNNGVPPSGATAVVLNVTVVSPTETSFLTVYPDGESVPTASNLNFTPDETASNLVIVPLGADGKVDFYNNAGSTQVVADVFGYINAGSDLRVPALSFASPTVDAADGGNTASQTVKFTVTDSDPAATSVTGYVVLRQFGTSPDTYVGQPLEILFTEGSSVNNGATFVSGTPARSTYSYEFGVPEYAAAASATWGVSLIVVMDGPGGQTAVLSGSALSGLSHTFTATEQVSTTTPIYQPGVTVTTTGDSVTGDPPYLYDGVVGIAQYGINVQDWQSGFWQGSFTITGPGGMTETAPFVSYADPFQTETFPCEGFGDFVWVDEQENCTADAFIPAGAPAGTWAVTSISLTNSAGQTKDYTGLDLAPITVTSDGVVKASSFKAMPTQVDNWKSNATTTISMDITGAQGGVSSIQLYTSGSDSFCEQESTTPTMDADGSYSISLTVDQTSGNGGSTCTIDGIAITDGAGNVSLYGSDFTPASVGLDITTVPDTTPPVATAASMSVTSIEQSQLPNLGNTVYPIVQTELLIAPIDSFTTTVYNSSGTAVGTEGGGVSVGASGQVDLGLDLPYTLPVGTYTVAFSLTDAGGLTTSYGGPGQNPVPGGPLTFTVTAG
jgi:hypothetical protein